MTVDSQVLPTGKAGKGHSQSGLYPTLRGVLFTSRLEGRAYKKTVEAVEKHCNYFQASRKASQQVPGS